MQNEVKQPYDPKKVNIAYAGHEMSGFAEDDFIEVEPLGDGVKSVSGADGEVALSVSADRRCKITLKLLQTSSSNKVLTNQYNAIRTNGSGISPFLIKDLTGKAVFSADQAWVTKMPKLQRGKEVGSVDWELEAVENEYTIGGSNASGGSVTNNILNMIGGMI